MRTTCLTLTASLALLACDPPTSPEPTHTHATHTTAAPAPAVDPAVEALARVKAGELVNTAQYEALALKLSDCPILTDGLSVDARCPTRVVLGRARLDPAALGEDAGAARAALGYRLLTAEHPAPRIWAVTLAQNAPEATRRLAQHARGEEHPAVLGRIARVLRTRAGKDPEITALLIELSKHAHPAVRREAAASLASSWAHGEASSLARVEEIVRDEAEDVGVRKSTCKALGRRGEASSLELLEEMTATPPPVPELYPACFAGLMAMWARPATHAAPNERAYEATMERLEREPRGERHPPWDNLSNLKWVSTPKLQEIAPWVDRARVERALESLVDDSRYNWLGREAALRTLVDLGVSASRLEKLKAHVSRGRFDDHNARILRTIEDQLRLARAREAKAANPATP